MMYEPLASPAEPSFVGAFVRVRFGQVEARRRAGPIQVRGNVVHVPNDALHISISHLSHLSRFAVPHLADIALNSAGEAQDIVVAIGIH
jgi:hypothetical protein